MKVKLEKEWDYSYANGMKYESSYKHERVCQNCGTKLYFEIKKGLTVNIINTAICSNCGCKVGNIWAERTND